MLECLRRLRLLRRAPVVVAAGVGVGDAVRGVGTVSGPGVGADGLGAVGAAGARGKVLGVPVEVGPGGGMVWLCVGDTMGAPGDFVRDRRLVGGLAIRDGRRKLSPRTVFHPQTWRIVGCTSVGRRRRVGCGGVVVGCIMLLLMLN
jgi:hypothetical protein